ncbi:hypothetical protein CFIMG_007261RA00001 [Ceratocystis fimbriata CBS 114723]|uniref:Uncharacterized protein n=1 Tax=Ceratocystis fimbriata CBS 114723 TaxID=1035309 RepID=A0A2C5WU36_9PEZI|nr:hypothetical protein CFIMG_007261RA00001 [Ceratocystis fimbriata CBS 114723]
MHTEGAERGPGAVGLTLNSHGSLSKITSNQVQCKVAAARVSFRCKFGFGSSSSSSSSFNPQKMLAVDTLSPPRFLFSSSPSRIL